VQRGPFLSERPKLDTEGALRPAHDAEERRMEEALHAVREAAERRVGEELRAVREAGERRVEEALRARTKRKRDWLAFKGVAKGMMR
jgi:hypothetical protein